MGTGIVSAGGTPVGFAGGGEGVSGTEGGTNSSFHDALMRSAAFSATM